MTGECVAVEVILPLRTKVGELQVERGEAGRLRGGGRGICLGVVGLGLSATTAFGRVARSERFRGL